MYGFAPTQEQAMLIEALHRYARDDARPGAHEADESGILGADLVRKGWELGLLQASVPDEYGGFGERTSVTAVLAAEELGWGDLSASLAVLTPSLFVIPILLAGSHQQRVKWIPQVIGNEWKPFTAAMIEPDFDFDPSTPRTVATRDAAGYVLNGLKSYVPYAESASAMIVFAAMDGDTKGFIVAAGSPGLTIARREKLLSLSALPLYEVKLEGVRVTEEELLPGDFAPVLAAMRATQAALAIGVARAAFEYSRDYAKEREAFGMKIAQKQAIAFMLAEMATEIEASRLLTWEAAWKLDAGEPDAPTAAYLAATGAADMVMLVTDRAVQVLGGHGYIRDHPVERWMREGRCFASLLGLAVL
jgi:acyl-CoA dehydrogenase